jgi:hypothetical protein
VLPGDARKSANHTLPAAATGAGTAPVPLQALDLLLSPLGCGPTEEFDQVLLKRATLPVEEPETNWDPTPGQAKQQDDQE